MPIIWKPCVPILITSASLVNTLNIGPGIVKKQIIPIVIKAHPK